MLVPEPVHTPSAARIEVGLHSLRPFVLGDQTHIEYRRTTVAFDVRRRDADIPGFASVPWDHREARSVLRLALTRLAFASGRAKSRTSSTARKSKQIATLRGG